MCPLYFRITGTSSFAVRSLYRCSLSGWALTADREGAVAGAGACVRACPWTDLGESEQGGAVSAGCRAMRTKIAKGTTSSNSSGRSRRRPGSALSGGTIRHLRWLKKEHTRGISTTISLFSDPPSAVSVLT